MDFATAAAAIRARLVAEWPLPDVPLYFENENPVLADPPARFCFVEITGEYEYLAEHVGQAGNTWRHEGAVIAHGFSPRGQGAAPGLALAEAALAILRGRRVDGLTFGAAPVMGLADLAHDGDWWRSPAEVDFQFERTAALP